MGAIRNCIEAGVPEALVISVAPVTGVRGNINSPGKQPAIPHPYANWQGVKDWEKGMSRAQLDHADEKGANAGIILGVPAEGWQYYCLDFDIDQPTLPNPENPRDPRDRISVAGGEALACGLLDDCLGSLWTAIGMTDFGVRRTLPWRGSVLVKLPATAEPGSKRFVHLSKDGATYGKIELLANGQQTVISGEHISAGRLKWSKYMSPNVVSAFPRPNEDWVPSLPNYNTLHEALTRVTQGLQAKGFTTESKATSTTPGSRDDTPPALEEQAAPSVALLLRTLHEMANPGYTDRAQYVNQQLAVVGCCRAMVELGRVTTAQELEDVLMAAAEWAARWEGPNADSVEVERQKFEDDWKQRRPIYVGWRHIAQLAMELGVKDIPTEAAQNTFEPLEDAPVVSRDEEWVRESVAKLHEERRPDQIANVPMADVAVADYVCNPDTGLGNAFRYVPADKAWLQFEPGHCWHRHDKVKAIVGKKVEDILVNYVAKFQCPGATELQNSRDQASMMSHKRKTSIVSMAQDRLAVAIKDLDKGDYRLQTPGTPTDLRDSSSFGVIEQRSLLDSRCTAVAPKPGPMPLFDSLMWNLSDHNPEVMEWLWAFLGYSLLGQPNQHVFVFLWGPGGNGKSVLLNVLDEILGAYSCLLDRDVILATGAGKHPTSLNRLRAVRLAMVSEMPPNEKWNEARLKALTGRDKTEARNMGADATVFRPEAAFLVAGQHLPRFHKVDNSVARRVRVIASRRVPAVPDPMLEDKILAQEAPQVLHRLVAEARKVFAANLTLPPVPPAMQREAAKYLSEQDHFHGWFASRCEITENPDEDCLQDALRASYDAYCSESDTDGDGDLAALDTLSQTAFLEALRRNGVVSEDEQGKRLRRTVEGKKVYFVRGVRLKSSAEVDPDKPS